MVTQNRYALGWRRGPERPERWQHRLIPPTVPDITKQRSLAQYINVLFDQAAEGSCTANAGCLVAQMVAAIEGTPTPTLSREHLYYIEREFINTFPQDSGADVVDEVQAPQKYGGIVADSVWTYDANPAEKPNAAVAKATKYNILASFQPIAATDFRDGILTALDNMQPVSIGLSWFNGWFNDFDNGLLTSAGMDYVAGGHAVVIIGWCPPSAALSQGGYLIQNSWGATSKARPDLHPDATAGRFVMPAELFALSSVTGEADAAVGQSSPAILTVTITPPSSVTVGQAAAFSAAVTGAPTGTVISYAWDFGATGQNATWTPTAAGQFTVTCTASVATTGASASGSAVVTVQAAPAPQPTPTPTPTPTVNCAASAQAIALAQYNAMMAQYQAGKLTYDQASAAYASIISIWQGDGNLSGTASTRNVPPPPVPR